MRLACAAAVVTAVALVTGSAGCSNRDSPRAHPKRPTGPPVVASAGPGGVQVVTIEVDDGLRFRPSVVEMRPGKLTIRLHDGGTTPHNLRFTATDRGISNVVGGQTREATFTAAAPGTYSFVCTYHERLGMNGSVVVR
jgi:plastocyanin